MKWLKDEPLTREIVDVVNSLSPAPEPQSPQNILNALNDDCLRTIFESEILDILDLCSAASVCKRFKRLANNVINTMYRHEIAFPHHKSTMLCRLEEYLENVGDTFTSITITDDYPSILYRMFAKFGTNIHALDCWLHDTKGTLIKMRPLIERIQKLRIFFDSPIERMDLGLNQLLTAKCPMLEELIVKDMYHKYPKVTLPTTNLSKLSSVEMMGVTVDDEKSTASFFSRNRQLDNISICATMATFNLLKYGKSIQYLKLLGSCCIHDENDLWFQFDNLKRLDLQVFYRDRHLETFIEKLADSRVLLEKLNFLETKLDDTWTPNIVDNICRMPSIKQLKINNCCDGDLLRFNQYLVQLENIHIFSTKLTTKGVREFFANVGASVDQAEFQLHRDNVMDDEISAIERMAKRRRIRVKLSVMSISK